MARQEGFEPPTLWFVAGYENAHKPHYKRKLKLICIHFAYISVDLLFEELVKVLHFLSLILVIEMGIYFSGRSDIGMSGLFLCSQ